MQCKKHNSNFFLIFLIFDYLTTTSARLEPFSRDYEYPELQLLFKSKEEINNTKEEENYKSGICLKPVKDEWTQGQNKHMYEPSPQKKTTETKIRPWLNYKYLEHNEINAKTRLDSENSLRKQNDETPTQNIKTTISRQKNTLLDAIETKQIKSSISSNENSFENIEHKLNGIRNINLVKRSQKTTFKADISRVKPNMEASEGRISNLRTLDSSKSTHFYKNDNPNMNCSLDSIITERSNYTVTKKYDDGELISSTEKSNYAINKFNKLRHKVRNGLKRTHAHVTRQTANKTSKQKLKQSHKEVDGLDKERKEHEKQYTGDRTLKRSTHSNITKTRPENEIMEQITKEMSSEELVHRNEYVDRYINEIELKSTQRVENLTSKMGHISRPQVNEVTRLTVTPNLISSSEVASKKTSSGGEIGFSNHFPNDNQKQLNKKQLNDEHFELAEAAYLTGDDAMPMTFPIPEQNQQPKMPKKTDKGSGISSDIVARPPIKIMVQSEKKTGKSLANSIPLPDKSNPIECSITDSNNIEGYKGKDSSGIVTMNVKTDFNNNPVEVKVNYITQSNRGTQINDQTLSKENVAPLKENITNDKKESQICLKKTLNTEGSHNSPDQTLELGDTPKLNQQSALVEDEFYSLTNTNAPTAKLTALMYKIKNKGNMINLVKRRKVNPKVFGMKRSVRNHDPQYEIYDNDKLPISVPSKELYYDYQDDYDLEYDNTKPSSMTDGNKIIDTNRKHQKQDYPEEYYFYVDKSVHNRLENKKPIKQINFPDKHNIDVFAHPLAIDDPELEIIHSGGGKKKKQHDIRYHIPKIHKMKSSNINNFNNQKIIIEQEKKLMNTPNNEYPYKSSDDSYDNERIEKL